MARRHVAHKPKTHHAVGVTGSPGHTKVIYDKRPHVAHVSGDSLKGIVVVDPWGHKGSAKGQGGSRRPSTRI